MEIVLGRDAEPDLAASLALGAGRLTRAFLPDDLPSAAQLTGLRRHVTATLREVADRLRWEGTRTGPCTSKTFKQLAHLPARLPSAKARSSAARPAPRTWKRGYPGWPGSARSNEPARAACTRGRAGRRAGSADLLGGSAAEAGTRRAEVLAEQVRQFGDGSLSPSGRLMFPRSSRLYVSVIREPDVTLRTSCRQSA